MTIPPVFVISLPGSPRRARIRQRLEKWPGEWSFVDAIDGAALPPESLDAVYSKTAALSRTGRLLAPGEIGCALSHRKVYGEILARDLDRAIVLEDDAVLGETFFVFPFDDPGVKFDVISFYTGNGLIRRRAAKVLGAVTLHRAENWVHNTVGYLVSREGARKLYKASSIIRSVADWPIYPDHLAFYVATPFPVTHEAGPSAIEELRQPLLADPKKSRHRLLARLMDGNLGYVTIPLFLKYFLYRRYYDGPYNYFWREIAPEVKAMLPFYVRLGG